MSFGEFDPKGGDLGRAKELTQWEKFSEEIYVGIKRLELERAKPENKDKYLRYAIEVIGGTIGFPEMEYSSHILYKHRLSWYQTDGIRLFNMAGSSGSILKRQICYIISEPEEK